MGCDLRRYSSGKSAEGSSSVGPDWPFVTLSLNFCNFIGVTDCMCVARGLWQPLFGIGVHFAWARFLTCWRAPACCA